MKLLAVSFWPTNTIRLAANEELSGLTDLEPFAWTHS